MAARTLTLVIACVLGCATAGRQDPASPLSGLAAPDDTRIPELLKRPPWSLGRAARGQVTHLQHQAGLQFPPRVGELARREVHVYDERSNDVGVAYAGFVATSPECFYTLSVFVYPATEPLPSHLEAVRAEFIRASPDARATDRILSLDGEHGAAGVHMAYLGVVSGRESFEGASIYERGGWFIKYRTTFLPEEPRM